ncbi:MAG: PAS domain S-box protein [Desulfobulbus sp.]|nr:MAG: PAS domain S-box protein [Desulfobulbus sp.]
MQIKRFHIVAVIVSALGILLVASLIAPSYEEYSLGRQEKEAAGIAHRLSSLMMAEYLRNPGQRLNEEIFATVAGEFNLAAIELVTEKGEVLYSDYPHLADIDDDAACLDRAVQGQVSSRRITARLPGATGEGTEQTLTETYVPFMDRDTVRGTLKVLFFNEEGEGRLALIVRNNTLLLLALIVVVLTALAVVVLRNHRHSNVAFLPPRLRKRVHPLFIGMTVFLLQLTLMMTLHPICKDWSSLMSSTLEAALFLLLITPLLYYFQVIPLVEVITDKRKIEQTLRESEQLFKTTFYDAPLGAAIVGIDGTIANANGKLAEFLGYGREELPGRDFVDLLHPETREKCHGRVGKLVSGELDEYNLDLQFIRQDGEAAWGHLSVKVVKDAAGAPQYLLPMVEDITTRKSMEQKIALARENWEETFANIPDGIVILNSRHEIVRSNPAFKKLLKAQHEQGRMFHHVLHCPRQADCNHYALFNQCIFDDDQPRQYPHTIECYNEHLGRHLELTVNTFQSSEPGEPGFVLVVRDVTDRKKAEMAIAESERRYSLLAENSSDIIWTTDLDLKITYISPAVQTVRGYSPEEMIGMSVEDSLTPESAVFVKGVLRDQLVIEQSGKGKPGRYLNMEIEAYRKDGSRVWLEVRVSFLRDRNNVPSGVLGVSRDITERRQAEQRLLLLEKAVNTTRTGITFRDTGNIIRFINPADAAMHGYDADELLGKHIRVIAPSKYVKGQGREQMDLLTAWNGESKTRRKDGSEFPVSLVSDVVRDESGEILGVITICEDITQRVKIEGELRKLSRAIEQSPVSVVITNRKGDIEYVNPAFCRNTGYSFEEAIGENPRILKSGWQSPEVYQDLWATISSGNIWRGELSNKTRAGEIFWENVVISPIKDQEGEITHFIAVKENITEQKKAKDAILSSEARLRSIMDGVTDSLITVSEEGVVESCNPATETMFGYSAEELIGKKVQLLLPEQYHRRAERFFRELSRSKSSSIGRRLTLRGRRKGGATFPLSLSLGTARLAGHTLFAATIRDISDIKENQRALREAKANAEMANAAKSDFLARMSHEIRTPMNAIIGMGNLIRMSSLDPQQVHYVENISSASKSLLKIINDILDFSKIEAGRLSLEAIEFRLDDIFSNMKNVIGLPAYDKGIELLFHLDEAVPPVLVGDPLRLEQVLTNLANNAVKFTCEGEVTIQARVEGLTGNEAIIGFSVKDTGIGMDPAQVDSLFNPFTQADGSITRQYGGTGLGLTICKRLVEMMGGRICVESEVGKGSTFSFMLTLPFKETAMGDPVCKLAGLTAIVVDPGPESGALLCHFLENVKIRTVWAAGIEEGIARFADMSGDARQEPDLLIVDVTSSSFEVNPFVEWMRDHPKVRSICVTGLAIKPELKNRDFCSAYVSKPIIKSQLLDTVQRVMQLSSCKGNGILGTKDNAKDLRAMRGKKVLLVEDNAINQLYAVKILEKLGIGVDTAKNGAEAVKAVVADSYDLVLMDMEMPVMDGLKATAEIRRIPEGRDLPIVAMTAHAMEEHRQLALNSGMDDYIAKPIELKNMTEVLIKWLAMERAGSITRADCGGTAGPIDAIPGIDFADGLARLAGDRDLYLQILGYFHETYAAAPGNLSAWAGEGKRMDVLTFAHSISGAAGNIGAIALHRLGKEIESILLRETGQVPQELIDRFEKELQRVLSGLAPLAGKEDPAGNRGEQ